VKGYGRPSSRGLFVRPLSRLPSSPPPSVAVSAPLPASARPLVYKQQRPLPLKPASLLPSVILHFPKDNASPSSSRTVTPKARDFTGNSLEIQSHPCSPRQSRHVRHAFNVHIRSFPLGFLGASSRGEVLSGNSCGSQARTVVLCYPSPPHLAVGVETSTFCFYHLALSEPLPEFVHSHLVFHCPY